MTLPLPPPAWRGLAAFWALLLVVCAAGSGLLDFLGPPPQATRPAAHAAPNLAASLASAAEKLPPLLPPAVQQVPRVQAEAPARGPGPIPPPDPALEEKSKDFAGGLLPRIGADRRSPMLAYAAYANPSDPRPRIAILLSDLGMSQSDSLRAVRDLPPAVSLAVSPYAAHLGPLAEAARAAGHELLLGLPMEPRNYPLDNPGERALMTGNSEGVNAQRLDWALTRLRGYVGVTGALGTLRGERFAASPSQMDPVLSELAQRGLLYVDPRPGAGHPPSVVGRAVDLVIDDPPNAAAIEQKLAELERLAHDRGSAIGLAGPPLPVTVQRIAAWAATLASRGFVLMPVSAVAPIVPPTTAASAAP